MAFGKASYKAGGGITGAMAGDKAKFVDPNFSFQNAKALKRSNGLVSKLINKNVSTIVGSGYYFDIEDEKDERQQAAKNVLEKYCEAMKLKRLANQACEEVCVTGSVFIEKIYDKYMPAGDVSTLAPQIVQSLRESDIDLRGFTLPAADANLLGIKRVLPTEQMTPIVNKKGTIIAFRQAPGGLDSILFSTKEIIFMAINAPSGASMGVGLIEPIYSDAVELDKIVSLLPVIVRNYSEPKPVFVAPDKKTAIDFKNFLDSVQPGQKPVTWGKIDVKALEMSGEGSRFIEYINYLTQRVREHLMAPSQDILHNATEASATVLSDDYMSFVDIMQDYLSETFEQELFRDLLLNDFATGAGQKFWTVLPLTGEKELTIPMPKLKWGVPASGVENIDRNAVLMEVIKRPEFPLEALISLVKKLEIPLDIDEADIKRMEQEKQENKMMQQQNMKQRARMGEESVASKKVLYEKVTAAIEKIGATGDNNVKPAK